MVLLLLPSTMLVRAVDRRRKVSTGAQNDYTHTHTYTLVAKPTQFEMQWIANNELQLVFLFCCLVCLIRRRYCCVIHITRMKFSLCLFASGFSAHCLDVKISVNIIELFSNFGQRNCCCILCCMTAACDVCVEDPLNESFGSASMQRNECVRANSNEILSNELLDLSNKMRAYLIESTNQL